MMARIGRNFLFYSTYITEMDTFYDEGNYSDIPETKSRQDIIDDIESIGKAATEEAGKFFKDLGDSVENTILRKKGYALSRVSGRDDWGKKIWIWRKNSRAKGAKRRVQIGVYLGNKDNRGVLKTWVWVRGGRSSLESARDVLGTGIIDGNAIYLDDVLVPQFRLDGHVEGQPLIDKVNQAFGPFVRRLDAIWKS